MRAVLKYFVDVMWNFVRVEYEHVNNCSAYRAVSDLKSDLFFHKMESEGEELLIIMTMQIRIVTILYRRQLFLKFLRK